MYFLGIDLGSSSVKVTILDGATGQVVGSGTAPQQEAPIMALRNGWAEQNPADWWTYLQTALHKALDGSFGFEGRWSICVGYIMEKSNRQRAG